MTSLPYVYDLLQDFASAPGLRVHDNKTEALDINLPQLLEITFQFQWQLNRPKNLGVELHRNYESLSQYNYNKTSQKICHMLTSWSNLKLFCIGRINALKMSALPHLLYLFRTLLVSPPAGLLGSLENNEYICVGQKKRQIQICNSS